MKKLSSIDFTTALLEGIEAEESFNADYELKNKEAAIIHSQRLGLSADEIQRLFKK